MQKTLDIMPRHCFTYYMNLKNIKKGQTFIREDGTEIICFEIVLMANGTKRKWLKKTAGGNAWSVTV